MTQARLCDHAAGQLLLIDIQQRLVAAMPEAIAMQVSRNSAILARAARLLDVPLHVTRQYPKGLGELLTEVREAIGNSECCDKTSFSCCGEAGFTGALKQHDRPQVIIAGMETHVCVLQTAFELQEQGYAVFVVEDAVCSRRKLNHENALRRLAQVGVTITNTESVVLEWLRDAKHPHFKTISGLIK